MTTRQMFEYALIELNKAEAPSLLLEDYNYFINKAVQQYVNKVYNAYELDQQRTDDLRVLKSSAVLTPIQLNEATTANLYNADYTVELPDNYFHVLSCVVEYSIEKEFKCYEKNTTVQFGAKRLTADMFSGIINNYYMRPMYKRPYFYVNNSGYDFIKADHIKPEDATDNADEHDSNFIGTNSKNEVTYNNHVNYQNGSE